MLLIDFFCALVTDTEKPENRSRELNGHPKSPVLKYNTKGRMQKKGKSLENLSQKKTVKSASNLASESVKALSFNLQEDANTFGNFSSRFMSEPDMIMSDFVYPDENDRGKPKPSTCKITLFHGHRFP